MFDSIKESLNGVSKVNSKTPDFSKKPMETSKNEDCMCNKKTMVSRVVTQATLVWDIAKKEDANEAQVTLGFASALGNSVTSGSLPANHIPATVEGNMTAETLRKLLSTFNTRVSQMNYECVEDTRQLNQPISINESAGETNSSHAYIQTADKRRNNQQVDSLLTLHEGFDLDLFKSISIPASRLTTGDKRVVLTLTFEEWHPYGMIVVNNSRACKS